ncbi:uncharacterized protein BXZ73DRAFT_87149 [Epithele typhae]|uniref:uncharacterized protein n=1 Tax=Epithele typhae TaxID=378194 RepID=UPI002008883F|nr:uncharacterized protein BXZ73DRAFT_87149 [Epithele typhae]KAH9944201.1 hypothetical protein BXZ73DRAFT_87149 [Epithele typhae]
MFARKNTKVALTFFCLVVALGLATVVEANSLVHPSRDHVDISRRMVKKRADGGALASIFNPVLGGEGPHCLPLVQLNLTGSTGSTTTSGTDLMFIAPTQTTSGSSTTTTGTSSATSLTSSSTTSGSSSSTVSTSSTSSLSPTSAPENPATSAADNTQPSANRSTATITSVVPGSTSSSPSSNNQTTSASTDSKKITTATLTVIVAVAASVGAVALAWTLFRKWKLRPSSNFDDRMQPIDWQPTTNDDSGLPTHRRTNSNASHGSFHSSTHHGTNASSLPEHDFTAGPATLAPVGGYADLQRGPSPGPQMGELNRGPSFNHGGTAMGRATRPPSRWTAP